MYYNIDGRAHRRSSARARWHHSTQPLNTSLEKAGNQRPRGESASSGTQSLCSTRILPHDGHPNGINETQTQDSIGASENLEKLDEDLSEVTTHTFLKRVFSHISLLGKVHPREVTREKEVEDQSPTDSILLLPDRAQAEQYLDCFFDHLNATYRYLPRAKMVGLLNRVYSNDSALLGDNADMALFLSVIASG